MSRELSEMTLEELWELFPIFLVEHRETWKDDYREIEAELMELLSECRVSRISHIGSTAIAGIRAKNIIDVLIEIPMEERLKTSFQTGEFVRRYTNEARIKYGNRYG